MTTTKNRKRGMKVLTAALLAGAMLLTMPGTADAATARVHRGFWGGNATHYRDNRVTGMTMNSSHIHFAIMASCDYGDVQLGNANSNRNNLRTHRATVATNQSGWGKMNAGAHSFSASNGVNYTSPGGAHGWDRCF